jgi:conjugative relaxase-like TrwC/TraI family protein
LQGTSRDGDPHDHEHNLFARMVRTEADGRWRALDTMALRHQLPAMQAIVTAHAEAAMTRAFAVAWVPRADGAGNEIAGITQEQMDEFSSRVQDIEPKMDALVREFTAEYGTRRTVRKCAQCTRRRGTRDHSPGDSWEPSWEPTTADSWPHRATMGHS